MNRLRSNHVMFPNWQRVVPENTEMRGTLDLEKSGFGKDEKQTEKLTIALNAFLQQTGETINLRYLEDLPKKQWLVYSQSEKGKAFILKERGAEETNFAVVMTPCAYGAHDKPFLSANGAQRRMPIPPEKVSAAVEQMAKAA